MEDDHSEILKKIHAPAVDVDYPADKAIKQIISDVMWAEEVEPSDELGFIKNFKNKDQLIVEYYAQSPTGEWLAVHTRHFKIVEVKE